MVSFNNTRCQLPSLMWGRRRRGHCDVCYTIFYVYGYVSSLDMLCEGVSPDRVGRIADIEDYRGGVSLAYFTIMIRATFIEYYNIDEATFYWIKTRVEPQRQSSTENLCVICVTLFMAGWMAYGSTNETLCMLAWHTEIAEFIASNFFISANACFLNND